MTLAYRPLGPEDISLASAAACELHPHHPIAEDEMRLMWSHAAGIGEVERWHVSGADGDALGWCSLVRPSGAPEAFLNLVLPRADAGDAAEACRFLEAEAAERGGVAEVVSEVWDDLEAILTGLSLRGFQRRRRQRYWQMDLDAERGRLQAEHAEARARAEAAGVRIVQAGELGGERVYPALFEIHNRTHEDIPRSVTFVPEPYDVWLAWMQPPQVLPGRVWVAVAAGRPVGYSYLGWRSSGLVDTGYTGVLREFRGGGVARALKLATLVQAADLGVAQVETDNDAENGPIIHLNQALGYREIVGQVELFKSLAP